MLLYCRCMLDLLIPYSWIEEEEDCKQLIIVVHRERVVVEGGPLWYSSTHAHSLSRLLDRYNTKVRVHAKIELLLLIANLPIHASPKLDLRNITQCDLRISNALAHTRHENTIHRRALACEYYCVPE